MEQSSDQRLHNEIEAEVEKLEKGEISLQSLDNIFNKNLATLIRRKFIEKITKTPLPSIGSTILEFEEVIGKNAENTIGATQIPLGIVGPLKVFGDHAIGDYYVPMATTEGALIASVNRGVKAVTMSGGVRVKVLRDFMTRAPLIVFNSMDEAVKFYNTIKNHEGKLREIVKVVTRHGELIGFDVYVIGNNAWIRLKFDTGEAMGMNIATLASERICYYIEENYKAKCLALSGNVCVDKKPSWINIIEGRGKEVVAEAIIKREVIDKVFKARIDDIVEVAIKKNLLGSAVSGSMYYNAHFANIIAAIFIATGQDVAQVVESSSGFSFAEKRGEDLYLTVKLTNLEVGTVGGGTRLPTQREALKIMGLGNGLKGEAKKFAEIITSTVLAGELNLIAALAGGELAKGHEKYGRGKVDSSSKKE